MAFGLHDLHDAFAPPLLYWLFLGDVGIDNRVLNVVVSFTRRAELR
jgi:hypothetical protein